MVLVPAVSVNVEILLAQVATLRGALAAIAALVALVVRDGLHPFFACHPFCFIPCTCHLVAPLLTSRI